MNEKLMKTQYGALDCFIIQTWENKPLKKNIFILIHLKEIESFASNSQPRMISRT